LIGRSLNLCARWSREHEWVRRAGEHDHAALKEALGRRELVRETATQKVVDYLDTAVDVLYSIMTDKRQLPIFDRQGEQVKDVNGEPMFKPLVRASTRAQAAEKILGIGGLVAVKRTELVDRTAESLDAAAAVLRTLSPKQVEQLMGILSEDE
jgi:hypothetical protein